MLTVSSAIASNRFGLGARPGEPDRNRDEAAAWLLRQIEPGNTTRTDRSAPATATATATATAEILARTSELRQARRSARQQTGDAAGEVARRTAQPLNEFVAGNYRRQAAASLSRAIASDQPFYERLVGFWANHFAVSADKATVRPIAGTFVDEAIRPSVTGNFSTLLRSATKHPAMLLYLDNVASVGPNSMLAARANRDRNLGLNENLAREILELHTVGVDGGYTQDDIVELARALTGWSIAGQGPAAAGNGRMRRALSVGEETPAGHFQFRALIHEPGTKRLLGQRFAEAGVDEAEDMLAHLALRPATARFLATKLARHFVADEPPAALVDRLADAYLDHDGELGPIYAALIGADEAWREPLAKYKTPREYLVSAYRATGMTADTGNPVAVATQLGQRPLTPGSPAGWADTAAHWDGGDALLKRIEWATRAGQAIGDRIDAGQRLDEVLGATAGAATREAVARAESGAQAIALLFSAPEFQWR